MKGFRALFTLISLTVFHFASATCGSVNYAQGAEALKTATSFIGAWAIYTMNVISAIAAIVVVISALQIYIKMSHNEADVTKSILFLMGGIFFLLFVQIVAPAFFGYENLIITF